jgi:hypothetical protein
MVCESILELSCARIICFSYQCIHEYVGYQELPHDGDSQVLMVEIKAKVA